MSKKLTKSISAVLVLVILILAACSTPGGDQGATPTVPPTAAPTVALTDTPTPPPTPTINPEQRKMELALQITALVVNPRSEEEVWENVEQMAPLMLEAYCLTFPGCNSSPLKVEILNGEEFDARRKAQFDDIDESDAADKDSSQVIASVMDDGTIIINKDMGRVRDTLEQLPAPQNYQRLASIYPALYLEEIFHRDTTPRDVPPFTIKGSIRDYEFVRFNGYGFEREDLHKWSELEEAASLVASMYVQAMLGARPTSATNTSYNTSNYLGQQMLARGVTVERLVEWHRTSDVDTLLQSLYPDQTDTQSRRQTCVNEYTYVASLPIPEEGP